MTLPPYLLCFALSEMEQQIIIQTKPPNLVASVWTFAGDEQFRSFVSTYSGLAYCTIDGWQVVLTYSGSLQRVITNQGTVPMIQNELSLMAEFFKKERILRKPGYFKKFMR